MLKRICIVMIGLLYMVTSYGFAVKLHHFGNPVSEIEINKRAMAKTIVKGGYTGCASKYFNVYAAGKQLKDTVKARTTVAVFFSGKHNAQKLVTGKSVDEMFVYFKKYLEIKDKARADTMSAAILNIDKSTEMKYQLSLSYYKFLGITEVKRLFLSAGNDVKSNRAYMVTRRTTDIKNQNSLLWARNYIIVQLDSAYSNIDLSDSVRKQTGEHYNSLAWYSLLTKQAGKARYYLNKSISYNPKSKYYNTNYPHVLLFNGEYIKAREWYLKYKNLPFDDDYPTYKDVFLEDIREFEKAGLRNEHLKELTALLSN